MTIPDEAGCGHYRVKYPATAAEAEGVQIAFLTELPGITLQDRRIVDVPRIDADVMVMQRPLWWHNAEMIPHIQRKGTAVVVDIDDDLSALDRDHMAYKRAQPETNPDSNKRHLARACAMADMVTCSTPALAKRYGSHGRVQVLPNYVPEAMLRTVPPARPEPAPTVGWGGYVETHPHDLEAARGGVGMACREAGARFLNVGIGNKVQDQLELHDVDFAITGPVPFDEYPAAVARFDVGIVPLADTRFNEAKSGLKGLEYAAVGVPFVASPTPDYLRLASEGIGVTAKPRSRSWKREVLRLLGDDGDELAARAKARVREKHTYEMHGWRWVEVWQRAMENRRART